MPDHAGSATVLFLVMTVLVVFPVAAEITPPPDDLSQVSFIAAFQTIYDYFSNHYPFSDHKSIDWPTLHGAYAPQIAMAQAEQDTALFKRTIRRFVHTFPDGHVRVSGDFSDLYIPEIGGGFGLTLIELDSGDLVANRVRPGSSADLAGMERGAMVLDWDGQVMETAIAEADFLWEGQPPATQSGRRLAQLRRLVRAPVGAVVPVTYANLGFPAVTHGLTAVDDTLATWEQTLTCPHFCNHIPC